MKLNRVSLAFLLTASIVAEFAISGRAHAVSQVDSPAQTDFNEQNDRTVDQAVLISKKNAIASLQRILAQRRSPDEPKLLMTLAEIQRNCAEYEFRIAHGKVVQAAHQKVLIDDYRGILSGSIATLNRFLTTYPTHADVPRAIFLRGKAYAEIGDAPHAIQDYTQVVNQYRASKDFKLAIVSLVDLLTEQKNFVAVLQFVNQARAVPSDDFYPILLDRSAWAQYNLGNIVAALQLVETQIRFYRANPKLNAGDNADLEKTLNNATLFYFAGVSAHLPEQTLENSLAYFEKIGGPVELGHMMESFCYLLRTKGMDPELETIKKLVLASDLSIPDKTLILVVIFENETNRHLYALIQETSNQLENLLAQMSAQPGKSQKLNAKNFARLNKSVADASAAIQKEFIDDPTSPNRLVVANTLRGVYSLLIALNGLNGKDAEKLAKIHTNLAEIDFALKDYPSATKSYRWVVDYRGLSKALEAALKAISSRYEELSAKNVFPKEMSAHSIASTPPVELAPEVKQWISWIDDYSKAAGKNISPDAEVFQFEATRLLYAQGHITESINRATLLISQYPSSRYAAPAVALIMDTYVAGEEWEKVRDTAQAFLARPEFKKATFTPQLIQMAEDSSYKLVEIQYRAKNYARALEDAQKYMKDHPTSKNREDCVAIAANASLALGNKAQAVSFFDQLHDFSKVGLKSTAILTKAALAEENAKFAEAEKYYLQYLQLPATEKQLPPDEIEKIRTKIALYEFFEGDYATYSKRVSALGVCTGKAAAVCEGDRELSNLFHKNKLSRREIREAGAMAFAPSSSANASVIWASVALEGVETFSLKDRYHLFQVIENRYAQMDSIPKLSVIPFLNRGIVSAVQLTREDISKSSHLKLDKKTIAARARMMEEFSTELAALSKIPFASIRAQAFDEGATLYHSFAKELRDLPKPKGAQGDEIKTYDAILASAAQPFEEKSLELRKKAFQIASESGVESDILSKIAQNLAADAPEYAHAPEDVAKAHVDVAQLESDFTALLGKTNLAKDPLYLVWLQALHDRRLPSVAFYTQQLKDAKMLDSSCEPLMEAAGLLASNSQAEAALILKSATDQSLIHDGSISRTIQHILGDVLALAHYSESKIRVPASQSASPKAQPSPNSTEGKKS